MQARLLAAEPVPGSGTEAPVIHLVLSMPGSFRFRAGQYVEIELPGGAVLPLSIASGPARLPELHLNYRSSPGDPAAAAFDDLLAQAGQLSLRGPAGNVQVDAAAAGPLLLIAGGTGAAQALGILDALAALPAPPAATLLWCADTESDLYASRRVAAIDGDWLERELIVDPTRSPDNRALRWLESNAARLAGRRTIVSGGPAFVYAVKDTLTAAGFDETRIESDVFSYAPRASGVSARGSGSGSAGSSRSD